MFWKENGTSIGSARALSLRPIVWGFAQSILWLASAAALSLSLAGCPVTAPPVTSITPDHGPTAGGTDVTIRGTGFDTETGVLFGEQAARSVQCINSGLMRATTPAQPAGEVPLVLIDSRGADISTGFSFTYDVPEEAARPAALAITSITPGHGPTVGGTRVTIRGAGFVDGSAVLFGELSAADVIVTNDGLMAAMSPPHGAGLVDMTLVAPDGRSVTQTGAFEYAVDADGDGLPDIDTDGDGLVDWLELEGWDIWVDYFGIGLGTDTFGNFPGLYSVTSDPNNPDTDGDGLGDYTEHLILSDPRKGDTDEDGLTDAEERGRWHTSPISVDTDADCRGPSGELVPDAALFDGRELFTAHWTTRTVTAARIMKRSESQRAAR